MLLFRDLLYGLCLSVFISLLFATANLFSRGKSTSSVSMSAADMTERRTRQPQSVDLDNGISKDGNFGGAECDEIVDEDNAKIIKEVRDLDNRIHKESIFSGFEREEGGSGEKSRAISIVMMKSKSDMEEIKVAVLESEISKERVTRGIESEEHIVDESPDGPKNQKVVTKSEKNFVNEEELHEVKVLEIEISEKIVSSCVEFEDNLVDESQEREKYRDIVIRLEKKTDTRIVESKECNIGKDEVVECKVKGDDDEGWIDDWEGIESTKLEKRFGYAVVFVGSKGNTQRISSLDNEVKMQLYGLHKVAIEGPCRVQPPMALKVSARAKWNAWHLLGDMSREVAMDQYIALLSKSLPEWSGDDPKVNCVRRTGDR